jgi:hypothetical protein
MMSAPLIAIIGIGYAVISAEQFYRSNPWMGVVFFGYAVGNVGLWMLAK